MVLLATKNANIAVQPPHVVVMSAVRAVVPPVEQAGVLVVVLPVAKVPKTENNNL